MPAPPVDPPRPDVVLLDVGGVFLLPDPGRLATVFARAGFEVPEPVMVEAHYVGTTAFTTDYDGAMPWREFWHEYNRRFARACGVPDVRLTEIVDQLEGEFATGRLWTHVIAGAAEGLRELAATGVAVGIVSNAEGQIAQDLRDLEILQVGPGIGVDVACVIDSGAVGVEKPDPRIFKIALDAIDATPAVTWYVGDTPGIDIVGAQRAGVHPVLMDPFDVHTERDVMRVHSLHELAARVAAARDAYDEALEPRSR